jgi:chromosome segregation ATPase
MRRLAGLRLACVLILGVALLASAGVILYQRRQLAALRQQRDEAQQSLRHLREALRQLPLEKTPVAAPKSAPLETVRAALARHEATIARLDRELAEAKDTITQLQAQLVDAGNEREKDLANAQERFQKQEGAWQVRLDALQQQLDSAQAESQAARQRLAGLEATNARLKSDNSLSVARAAEVARTVEALRDLNHRRDVYLTSILRRYRDITGQFRAMGGMLDSSRDQNSSAFSDAALTRIQNAISLTEDDISQLNELNAQAHKLEKRLAKQ